MLQSYFKLSEKPFQLHSGLKYFYTSEVHAKGLSYLRYGLYQGCGFVVLTGEPGCGKSFVVQALLSELNPDKYISGVISSTLLESTELLKLVASAFGLKTSKESKGDLVVELQRYFATQCRHGKNVLLVVDEAQNLSRLALEELRMLANPIEGAEGALQIFLVGQLELTKELAHPDLYQLAQRIIASCELKRLSLQDMRGYIDCRLRAAQWQGNPSFSADALKYIFAGSKGIPRLVNILCDRILLSAFSDNASHIDEAMAKSALLELVNENPMAWQEPSEQGASFNENAVTISPLPHASDPPFDVATPAMDRRGEEVSFAQQQRDQHPPGDHDVLFFMPADDSEKKEHTPRLPSRRRHVYAWALSISAVCIAVIGFFYFDSSQVIAPEPVSSLHEDPLQGVLSRVEVDRMPVEFAVMPQEEKEQEKQQEKEQEQEQQEKIPPAVLTTAPAAQVAAIPESKKPDLRVQKKPEVEPAIENDGQEQRAAEPVPQQGSEPVAKKVPEQKVPRIDPVKTVASRKVESDVSLAQVKRIEQASPTQSAPVASASASKVNETPAAAPKIEKASQENRTQFEAEKSRILSQMSKYYGQGNIDGFLSLFSRDAVNGNSASGLSRDYQQLFTISDMRRITFSNFNWNEGAEGRIKGTGKFKADVWLKRKSDPIITEGIVNIDLVNKDGQLYISKIDHIEE